MTDNPFLVRLTTNCLTGWEQPNDPYRKGRRISFMEPKFGMVGKLASSALCFVKVE